MFSVGKREMLKLQSDFSRHVHFADTPFCHHTADTEYDGGNNVDDDVDDDDDDDVDDDDDDDYDLYNKNQ